MHNMDDDDVAWWHGTRPEKPKGLISCAIWL